MAEAAAPKKMKKIMVPRVVNGYDTMVEIEVEDTGGPSWGPNDAHPLLNKNIVRVDGPVKVTGQARYTADVRLEGMLHGRVLWSPHARARVKRFDDGAARRVPGVKAVVKGADDVLYEGTAVAAVAATSPEAAADGLRALVVEYEVLRHVVRPEDALSADAPKVFPEGNVEDKGAGGDAAKADAAWAGCDAVREGDYKTSPVHHCCLETHGIVVDYRGGDTATVYASTQGTFSIPNDAAQALGLPGSQVRSIVEHMGGGFGSKFGIGVEGKMACELSKATKAPVKMMLRRHDEFLMGGYRSGSWQTLKGGVKKDGTWVALKAEQRRIGGVGDGSQANQPYVYGVETAYRNAVSIHTHKASSNAFRAPGHPQASFGIEMLADELAYAIGMDAVAFRKKNLKDPVYHRQLDRGAKEIGWERRSSTPGAGKGPVKRGFGCAVGAWGGGGSPQCIVDVTIAPDGAVKVAVGSQDLGTGTRTYTRAIVAEELGLGMKDVVEAIGDSKLGAANASGGSTTTASLAPAVKDAAVNARRAMAEKLVGLLGAAGAEDVHFVSGNVRAGAKSLSWKQACAALPSPGVAGRGEWKESLATRGTHGACFAEVEVDVETGRVKPIKMVHVQDCGLPLNRLAVMSQINGGMIQSLGMVLYEGNVMDAHLGITLNPSFESYKMPGILEIPELVPIIDDDDDRMAVVGMAEPAIVPAVGALANAVHNAIGVPIRETPITPDKILMALESARRTS